MPVILRRKYAQKREVKKKKKRNNIFEIKLKLSCYNTYRGRDKRQKRNVAIKVEPENRGELSNSPNDPRRLVIEQQVLLALRKKVTLSFLSFDIIFDKN